MKKMSGWISLGSNDSCNLNLTTASSLHDDQLLDILFEYKKEFFSGMVENVSIPDGTSARKWKLTHSNGDNLFLKVRAVSRNNSIEIPSFFQKSFLISQLDRVRDVAPAILRAEVFTVADPRFSGAVHYTIQEWRAGVPAARSAWVINEWPSFVRMLGSILRDLHGLHPSGSSICREYLPKWRVHSEESAYFDSVFSFVRASLGREKERSLLSRLERLLQRPSDGGIAHNDVLPNWANVLVSKDEMKIKAIVDWDHATVGDPLVTELGGAISSILWSGRTDRYKDVFLDHFLTGYGMSMREYCKNHEEEVETMAALRLVQRFIREARSNSRCLSWISHRLD